MPLARAPGNFTVPRLRLSSLTIVLVGRAFVSHA
jgi:hypothetical protein